MNGREKDLICVSDGYVYRIVSDDRFIYFHKLCREGKTFDGNELGRLRLVKAEIEFVECRHERGRTVVIIQHSGLTSRMGVKGNIDTDLLLEIFKGVKLKLSLRRHYANAPEQQELMLLFYCFMFVLLRVLCYYAPELEMFGPYIAAGWIVLPLVWMVFCARQPAAEGLKNRFPFAAGLVVAILCCISLWVTADGSIMNWTGLILPSVILSLAIAVFYTIMRGCRKWKEIAAVGLFSLILFAPAVTANVNQMLPAWEVHSQPVTVVEVGSSQNHSNLHYHAYADVNGEKMHFTVSQPQAAILDVGSTGTYYEKTGFLGIKYCCVEWE